MVDMVVRCLQRTGNKGLQTKVKPGTTFTARTSLMEGSPRPAVCRLCVRVPVLLKRFRSIVRWTVEHPLVWVGWVADDKALDPRDYPIKLWRSHVGCNKVTGNCIWFIFVSFRLTVFLNKSYWTMFKIQSFIPVKITCTGPSPERKL